MRDSLGWHYETLYLAVADGHYPPVFIQNGSTALIWAVNKGRVEAVEVLVTHGADLNMQTKVSYFCESARENVLGLTSAEQSVWVTWIE